jgi:hypothetical protein
MLYRHAQRVLLLGDAAVEKCITATESEIAGKHIIIELLEYPSTGVGKLEETV